MKSTLKTEPHQIRLPVALWRDLAALATADNKSRAELIRSVLSEYARWKKQQVA